MKLLTWLHNLLAQPVQAQCDTGQPSLNLNDCLLLNDKGDTVASVYDTPAKLVNLIVGNLFIVAGVILFFMIIYSGFAFIRDSSKGKEDAQKIFTTAVIGYIIMFAAYWIVQIVQYITGADILF